MNQVSNEDLLLGKVSKSRNTLNVIRQRKCRRVDWIRYVFFVRNSSRRHGLGTNESNGTNAVSCSMVIRLIRKTVDRPARRWGTDADDRLIWRGVQQTEEICQTCLIADNWMRDDVSLCRPVCMLDAFHPQTDRLQQSSSSSSSWV